MPRPEANRPNVLVFFTDQQRWDTSGLHGNPLDLTPNFDRMGQRGTHVQHSFTCQPVCGPARSCLQTGMYATRTGCYRNGIPLPGGLKTLAHYFGEAGYATRYIGKWHLYSRDAIGPVPAGHRGGYDYWLASNVLEFTSDAYRTTLYDNDDQPVDLPGYRVDALTDAAIRYLDGHRNQPFYLFTSYIEPHHQNHLDDYPPPNGYRERYTGKVDTAGSRRARRLGSPAPGRVLRHGEEAGRGARQDSGRAEKPRPSRQHHPPVHLRPRLPLQDAQQRVQTLLPRELDPRADRVPRPRVYGRRADSRSW